MQTKYLDGFDYATYLRRHGMVGPVDPKFETTLVSLDAAMAECSGWSGQELHRASFISYLKANNIIPFRDIDDFVSYRDKIRKEQKFSRKLTPERRKQLSEQMKQINDKKRDILSPQTHDNVS